MQLTYDAYEFSKLSLGTSEGVLQVLPYMALPTIFNGNHLIIAPMTIII